MVERKMQVVNELGMHARPSALLVQKARNFKSEIKLKKEDREVNAKSMLSVMTLAVEKGSFITIIAEGEDQREAVEALVQLFAAKFEAGGER